jgi:hypothetical protein
MSTKPNVSDSDTKKAPSEGAKAAGKSGAVTAFVYAGPSLPGGRLKSLTTLNGTYKQITDYYKESIALYPNVARLIVPVAQLAEIRKKTQTSGNIIYNYYNEITAEIKAKGAEQ